MTIDSYGNVGIGTSTMSSLVDIYGATTSTAPLVTINQQGTGTILDVQDGGVSAFIVIDGGNVGIGLTEPMDTLHVNGGIISTNTQTSNLTIWNSLNIPMTSTNIRTRVQVHHIRKSFYVDAPTQSDFVVTYPGAFSGHQSNVQVFLGRDQLSYISPTIKDYDLTLTYLMEQQVTEYTISLTTHAVYGDIVDIIVWPQITQNSPEEQGIVYQSVLVNDSYWLEQDRTIPVRNTVPIYVLGNVGIGTTIPLEKLDIHGNVQVNGGVSITGNVLVTGDIVPSACNIFNLGASNFRFKDLFLSGNTIDLGGTLISRDETDGGIKVTSEAGEAVDTTVRNLFALGNIGIGLSNPQARLDIDGGIQVAGHVTPSVNIAFDLGTPINRFRDLYLSGNTIDLGGTLITRHESETGGGIKVTGENGELFDSTVRDLFALGNIGIGLSNPQARLDVDGGIQVAGHVVPSVNIAFDLGTPTNRFRDLYLSGNTIDLGGTQITRHESETGVGIKVTGENGEFYNATVRDLFALGNIGIGLSNPQARLDVDGGIQVAGHVIPASNETFDLGSSGARFRDVYLSGNTIDLGGTMLKRHVTGPLMVMSEATQSMESIISRHAYIEGTANACNVIINTNGTGTSLLINQDGGEAIANFQSLGNSVMLIEQTGRVGINTLPGEALHVHGNVLASGNMLALGTITASNLVILGDYVTLDTITSNTEQMVITNAGTGPALKVTQTGANTIAEFYDDGNALALKIADGGNVGIGTVTPKAKLHVLGTALASAFSGKLEHTLTKGDYLTGTNFTNESTITWAVDATTAETASKVVARDGSGDTFARLYRSTYTNQTTLSGALAFRVNNSTDNYIRFCSDTPAIRTFLDVPSNAITISTGDGLSGGGSLAANRTLTVDATVVRTTGNQTKTGILTVARVIPYSTTNTAGYDTAAIEVRELNQGGLQGGAWSIAPRIGFHWGGVVASQILMETNGRIAIVNNPGNAYESFAAGNTTINGTITSLNHCFHAHRNDTNIVYSNTVVIFQTILVNRGNCYNNSNGRFTASIQGSYAFHFHSMDPGNPNVYGAAVLRKNGSYYIAGHGAISSYAHYTLSAIVSLNVSDYVDIFIPSGYTNPHPGYWTNFSGHCIG